MLGGFVLPLRAVLGGDLGGMGIAGVTTFSGALGLGFVVGFGKTGCKGVPVGVFTRSHFRYRWSRCWSHFRYHRNWFGSRFGRHFRLRGLCLCSFGLCRFSLRSFYCGPFLLCSFFLCDLRLRDLRLRGLRGGPFCLIRFSLGHFCGIRLRGFLLRSFGCC